MPPSPPKPQTAATPPSQRPRALSTASTHSNQSNQSDHHHHRRNPSGGHDHHHGHSARVVSPSTRPQPVWWRDHGRVITALLGFEVFASLAIVCFVNYTEIDWVAYMQEVEGFLAGELDYTKIKGDTGPLVYPAGFVYIFSALYWLTNLGQNIFLAQCMWAALYITVLAVVFVLYRRADAPPVLMIFLVLSRRIHSIYMLRMFNDCVAIAFAYFAFAAMTNRHAVTGKAQPLWTTASVLYSLGVSVKMNLFLFAPAIFFIWLRCLGIKETARQIFICAALQVCLGAPFLLSHPVSYLTKAFELSRVFTYQWTVNFKFLTEDTFTNPAIGNLLMLLTLLGWFGVYVNRWRRRKVETLRPALILATLFESNMIGIAFSRTLHYQFYSWFFHQLPFVLGYSCATLRGSTRIAIMVAIEIGFNVYPSTWWSSMLVTFSLWTIAATLVFGHDKQKQWMAPPPMPSTMPKPHEA
jgi:alpha-1,3-mannosyltransferase